MTSDQVTAGSLALLKEWEQRLRINVAAHNNAERRFIWLDNTLGSISLVSIVSLGTIAVGIDLAPRWKAIFVLIVTGSGALASVFQTQLRLSSTALAHQTAARQYSALRRNAEEAQLLDELDISSRIRSIRQHWDLVASSAPNVPKEIRRSAKSKSGTPHSSTLSGS